MNSKDKVLCVIPARGGSKSIPLKNLVKVNGKPLLYYALSSALRAGKIDRVVVSSDNSSILDYAAEFGSMIPLQRPTELALDETPSLPVTVHALEVCEKEDNCSYETIILVQATNPLVTAGDIDNTIEKMLTTGCDSCFTVTKANHLSPGKLKKIENDRLLPYSEEEKEMIRRQDMPDVYIRNGACYGVKKSTALSGSMFGNDSCAVIVPHERSVDINDAVDILIAEALLKAGADTDK